MRILLFKKNRFVYYARNFLKQLTSDINCWKPESQKYLACENVYKNIWDSLRNYADKNNDERVTLDEWVCEFKYYKNNYDCSFFITQFAMWENLTQQMRKKDDSATSPEEKFPLWLYQYLLLRFNVLDRAGDGFIDSEEYEYAMSKYGVKGKDSRRSFLIFSE
uniref:EF-hand domain-containing protein n=1 Tax=Romanomermis culicivorax TaxID=13658 RepID=A0A915K922_ROMCU